MSFKTILVNLNHESRVTELVTAAISIARQSEAHVIGLYVMPPIFMPGDVMMPMGSDFFDEQIREHKAQAKRIEARFVELTRAEPIVAEWRVHGEAVSSYEALAEGVIAQSRTADLTIVSQAIDGTSPPMLADIAERVAIESGRPVLVVPEGWKGTKFGQRITVAWNNSREAARATFDALPFLKQASSIRIVTAARDAVDEDELPEIPAADIAESLARHGLKIDIATASPSGRNAAPELLADMQANGSDMLVMGAYGHARLWEFILGGTTRGILKTMTVPVLMSH